MAPPISTLVLSGCVPGMYTPGSWVVVNGQTYRVITNKPQGTQGNVILTVSPVSAYHPASAGIVGPQRGQGTSKACVTCCMALICGYHQNPVPFYFCPVCHRIYIPLVVDADASPIEVKQILIKKECPIKTVLDLKQPCQRCMHRSKLNEVKRKQKREHKRSQNRTALKGRRR